MDYTPCTLIIPIVHNVQYTCLFLLPVTLKFSVCFVCQILPFKSCLIGHIRILGIGLEMETHAGEYY